jgi:hypothetical protein
LGGFGVERLAACGHNSKLLDSRIKTPWMYLFFLKILSREEVVGAQKE